jgi:hypothetical protein
LAGWVQRKPSLSTYVHKYFLHISVEYNEDICIQIKLERIVQFERFNNIHLYVYCHAWVDWPCGIVSDCKLKVVRSNPRYNWGVFYNDVCICFPPFTL